MKFISFINPSGLQRAGWLQEDGVVDMSLAHAQLPIDMLSFLQDYEVNIEIINNSVNQDAHNSLDEVQLITPLPNPNSFRDFIAFETHLKNATARFGDPVPDEWYKMPIFYFSNHSSFKGDREDIKRPSKCQKLDFELEIACIIGKNGINIKAEEAEEYIVGYSILNDWTARDIQAQEMKCMLGPAKGKDFATSLGKYIVTKDELEPFRIANNRFDMPMKAYINGKLVSDGNFKDIHFTFGQMIERASEDTMLFAGDVIGSGTVGWGCLMESGATVHPWLEPGDEVLLSIEGLGTLQNKII